MCVVASSYQFEFVFSTTQQLVRATIGALALECPPLIIIVEKNFRVAEYTLYRTVSGRVLLYTRTPLIDGLGHATRSATYSHRRDREGV